MPFLDLLRGNLDLEVSIRKPVPIIVMSAQDQPPPPPRASEQDPFVQPPGPAGQPPQQVRYTSATAGAENDLGMRMLMPVGRSGWAIAAGYLGLISLLLIPAPFALITSILAIRDINKAKHTDQPKYGMGRAIFGLIMGILFSAALILVIFASLTDR